MIQTIQVAGALSLVAFLVMVTIGEDLAKAFVRVRDSFHPLDRELREITERVRRGG